jgi:hypothetical protein
LVAIFLVLTCATAAYISSSSRNTPRTAFPAPTTIPLHVGIQKLAIVANGALSPSPNGTMVADLTSKALKLFSLNGQSLATYTSSTGPYLNAVWLPDSSGLFVWRSPSNVKDAGAIAIMDTHGHLSPTGLVGIDPASSSDGKWLAATEPGAAAAANSVAVVPRTGGQPRIIASAATFLGWQAGRIIYYSPVDSSLYTANPADGTSVFLTHADVGELRPPSEGPATSPDGKVLVVHADSGDRTMLLTGASLLPYPAAAIAADPLLWVGPHAILGATSDDDMLIVDVITGQVTRDTRIVIDGNIEVISTNWVAWTDIATDPETLHLTNLLTGKDVNLGELPVPGPLLICGSGRFLLYGAEASYLIDSALLTS